jgi:hypothetical protein
VSPAALRRAFQIVGGLIALALLALTVRSAAAELAADPPPFRWGRAALAALGLAAAFLGSIGIWRFLLRSFGVRVTYSHTVQLWSFSNLGRYLPGKVWQVVGMVTVAQDLGLPAGLAATASFVNLGAQIGTGALVASALFPGAVARLGIGGIAVVALGVAVFVPVVWPGIVNGTVRRLPAFLGCTQTPPLKRGTLGRLVAGHVLAWLGQGAMFLAFASSLGPVDWADGPVYGGAYALAYVGGLVAVFAPGGIGVREGMIGWLLGSAGTGELPVHVLAVAARLWAISAEVLILVLALFLRFGAGRERS